MAMLNATTTPVATDVAIGRIAFSVEVVLGCNRTRNPAKMPALAELEHPSRPNPAVLPLRRARAAAVCGSVLAAGRSQLLGPGRSALRGNLTRAVTHRRLAGSSL